MKQPAFDKSLGSWTAWHDETVPMRLGVSSCLLGEEVRYDGGHSRNRFVADILTPWFEWVPVCPEMEIGLGIPRPTIRLQADGGNVRLVSPKTGKDFTRRMTVYSKKRVRELEKTDLDGYILKKGSPSCGTEKLPVFGTRGVQRRNGIGFFADTLMRLWPALPVETEARLDDTALRENFVERVFCHNRWRTLKSRGLTRRRLVGFHTAHKFLLQAHNEAGCRRLGKLLGRAGSIPNRELFAKYEEGLQQVMATKATRKKHVNVLQHAFGFLKQVLEPKEKREILETIDDFHAGLLPLVVPLTLLRYNIRKHNIDYLLGQLYFDPHPKELMLRNHV